MLIEEIIEQTNSTPTDKSPLDIKNLSSENSISKLANECFANSVFKQQKSNLLYTGTKATFIVGVAGSCIIFYIKPSLQYAKGEVVWQILYCAGSVVSNFALAAFTTQDVIDYLENKYKSEITGFDKKSIINVIKAIGEITLLSFPSGASALPFAAIYLRKSKNTTESIRRTVASIIFLDNTILHAFAFKALISNNIQFTTELGNFIKRLNDPNLRLASAAEKSLKQAIIKTLLAARGKLGQNKELLREIYQTKQGILKLLKLAQMAPAIQNNDNTIGSWLFNKLSYSAGEFTKFIGIVFSGTMTIGYIVDTYSELKEFTDNTFVCSTVTAIASIPLLYLACSFGSQQLKNIYQSTVNLFTGHYETPLAIKLYPKTTLGFMLVGCAITLFSYSVCLQLIDEHFNKDVGAILKFISLVGAVLFNEYAVSSLINTKIIEFARKYGGSDERAHARLSYQIEQFIAGIQKMDCEALIVGLKEMTLEQRQMLLKIDEQQVKKLIEPQKTTQKPFFSRLSFWSTKPSLERDEENEPIIESHGYGTINAYVTA